MQHQSDFNKRIGENISTPSANKCLRIDGPISRTVCGEVEVLRSEKIAAATRASQLEAKISAADIVLRKNFSQIAGVADASSSVLANVAAKFGWDVKATDVALILVFLPVLIVEGVGSLAWLLAGSIRGVQSCSRNPAQTIEGEVVKTSGTSVPITPEHPTEHHGSNDDEPGSGAKANVVKLLHQNGGCVQGGQRGLVAKIGASAARFNQVVKELAKEGRVLVSTDKLQGTTLQLT